MQWRGGLQKATDRGAEMPERSIATGHEWDYRAAAARTEGGQVRDQFGREALLSLRRWLSSGEMNHSDPRFV